MPKSCRFMQRGLDMFALDLAAAHARPNIAEAALTVDL
jgi:hypothetical protein